MNKCSPSGKKISGAQLNFRRRPILWTTLYKNLKQASNFGGVFDQLSLWPFCALFTDDASLLILYPYPNQGGGGGGTLCTKKPGWDKVKPGCKKIKNDQKIKSRWSCLKCFSRTWRNPMSTWQMQKHASRSYWCSSMQNDMQAVLKRASTDCQIFIWFRQTGACVLQRF